MHYTNLIAILQVKVAGFGVEAEVNTLPVVTDDVFSPRVLVVASGNKLMHSAAGEEGTPRDMIVSQTIPFAKRGRVWSCCNY